MKVIRIPHNLPNVQVFDLRRTLASWRAASFFLPRMSDVTDEQIAARQAQVVSRLRGAGRGDGAGAARR
jgi:hypothetical protein